MNKNITAIIIVSALALNLGACTPEQKLAGKHPGSYQSVETTTDAKGTTTVKESTTVVTVDENGNKKEVITSKITKDPKGLMNKTSSSTTETIRENQ